MLEGLGGQVGGLEASWKHLGRILEALGGSWWHVGGSWKLLEASWRHLGNFLRAPGGCEALRTANTPSGRPGREGEGRG